MDNLKYEFLERKLISIHRDQEWEISKKALDEASRFERFQLYDRKRMLQISSNGSIQDEINKIILQLLEIRKLKPDGSNEECLCMDQLTEFLSKLDLEDFRKVHIEGLVTE